MNDNIFGNKREISLPLRLKILFGGSIIQVLYGVFAFLMIFVLVFARDADFSDFTLASSVNTKGNITNITQTNSRINKRYVFAFDYTFLVNDKIYNNTSFSTDKSKTNEVIVEYLAKNPRNSRIMGMRQKTFPIYVALIVLFPISILFILFFGLKTNLKAIWLLKNGEIGYAKVLRTETTNVRVNNRQVIRIFYEFEDKKGKKHTFSFKSHEPEKITDEAQEMLFYDANNPKRNILKDSSVAKIVLKENNKFKSPSFFQAIILLVLPSIAFLMLLLGLLI